MEEGGCQQREGGMDSLDLSSMGPSGLKPIKRGEG